MSEVKVEIKADSSALSTGLAKAQKNIQNFSKDVTTHVTDKLAGAFSAAGVIGGIGILVAGVMSAGKAILDFAGDLQDSSDAMGISTDALQELNAVFLAGGSSAETTKKGLIKLTQSLQDIATTADGPARKALDALNISFDDIAGLTSDEAIYVIADAMKAATDKGAALDAAMTLLGKSASQMAPALFGGAEAMREMAATTPKISAEDLKSIADAGDFFDGLTTKMKVYSATALMAAVNSKALHMAMRVGTGIMTAGLSEAIPFVIKSVKSLQGPKQNTEGAAAFEAESLAIGADAKTVIAPPDPRIKAAEEAQAKMDDENQKKADAYAEKQQAAADKIADVEMSNAQEIEKQRRDQLDTEGQINALLEDRKNLQSEIASSSGMQKAQAQKDLISVEKDLATARDKAKKDMAAEGDEREKKNAADMKKKEDAAKKKKDLVDANKQGAEELAAQKKSGEARRDSILDQMVDEEMKTPMQRANEDRVARERERIKGSLERRMKNLTPGQSKQMVKLSGELKDLTDKELPKEVAKLTEKLEQVVNKINTG